MNNARRVACAECGIYLRTSDVPARTLAPEYCTQHDTRTTTTTHNGETAMSIHKNYLTLTQVEKEYVDDLFSDAFKLAHVRGVPLDGGDKAERAVEAFATWVVESRAVVVVDLHEEGLVGYVKAYAMAHYNDGGWDNVVECWEDEEIAEHLREYNATTEEQAVRAFATLVEVWAEHERNERIEREMLGGA